MEKFYVPPLGRLARWADALIRPLMRLPFIGYRTESPQLTHFWNNKKFPKGSADHLEKSAMVFCKGDPQAVVRRSPWDIRFRLHDRPQYVVLEPIAENFAWYVGWIEGDEKVGVSQIPIYGRVRRLIGSDDVRFFGVLAVNGEQIKIHAIARGWLGDRGFYREVELH